MHAKVKPPRLDGSKTGLFATRSPHRPNPIGLSLTKLDKIEQNRVHVSGIDLLDGTPVLDIKPYIFDYDYPKQIADASLKDANTKPDWISHKGVAPKQPECGSESKLEVIDLNAVPNAVQDAEAVAEMHSAGAADSSDRPNETGDEPETSKFQLEVVLTPRAERQLALFHCRDSDEHRTEHLIENPKAVKNFYLSYGKRRSSRTDHQKLDDEPDEASSRETDKGDWAEESVRDSIRSLKCRYCLEFLGGPEEAKRALVNTLAHDPRSAYRRARCPDRLYYFTLDTMHVTAWFDEEDQVVEVVKIKPNYL